LFDVWLIKNFNNSYLRLMENFLSKNSKQNNKKLSLSKGTSISLSKRKKNKRTSVLDKNKTNNLPTIKIREVAQEDDYNKKIEKLKIIIENKHLGKKTKKKNLISDSKYKLIVSVFGISIVNNSL